MWARFLGMLCALAALSTSSSSCAGHAALATTPHTDPRTSTSFAAEPVDVTVDWEGSPPPATTGVKPAAVSLTASDGSGLRLAWLEARAVLYGPLAFTELHLAFENTEDREREGTFAITLPATAAVSRFALRLPQGWQEGEVVEQKLARATYERFLHRGVDPALLEKDAGNVFRGRVFPILAKQRKEIVISWTEELSSAESPYRLALRGLPALDLLDVELLVPSRKKAFVLHRQKWAPERDFLYSPPRGSPDAVRAGELTVARITPAPSAPEAAARVGSLAVLVDSSASQAQSYARNVERVREVVSAIGAKTVQIACFDQDVEPMPSFAEAAKRAPAGASDLRSGLRWLGTTGAKRVLVVSDGLASAGPIETSALAAEVAQLKARGVERLDAIAFGSARDEVLLRALANAGLPNEGVVVDGETLAPAAIAQRLGRAAPAHGGFVALEGAAARNVIAEDAPRQLVERAAAKLRIEMLMALRDRPGESESERARLRDEIVLLSTRNRVLSPFTSMLVLETEYDYQRFSIARTALNDILVVGPHGVELVPRGGGPVLLRESSKVSPLLDFRAKDGGNVAPENVDSDGDGIPDVNDKCPMEPETWNGIDDDDGCPDKGRVQLESSSIVILQAIHFQDGSATILPDSFPILDALAAVMRANPVLELVQIQGHTDDRGNAEANLVLSRRRAQAVLEALVARGVERQRLEAKGFGGTRPVADNATEEGRGRNRRVETRILRITGQPPIDDTPPPPPPPRAVRAGPLPLPFVSPNVRPGKEEPHGPPLAGTMHEIDMLLAQKKLGEALDRAEAWRSSAPADLLARAAEGRALEATGRYRDAARAYGSMLDLATKPEHRRGAAGFLESLGDRHPAALELAIDAYRRAAAERPELPSSHRLLAYALARAGRVDEGFEVILAALIRNFDVRRHPGSFELMKDDAGLFAAALSRGRAQPERDAFARRAKAVGAALPTTASTRIVLSWETDESDLDLRLVDPKGTVTFPREDAQRGYGPEAVLLERGAAPLRIDVHQVSRGPSGFILGKIAIVRHDGRGGLAFEDRPFVTMNDGAAVDLGSVERR